MTPVVANYPGDANYAASVSSTFNQDIVAHPVLQFSASSVTVDETVGSVTLNVVHSGSALGPVTVAYASATAQRWRRDDGAVSGTLSWSAGDGANQTIVVPIVSDTVAEPLKRFTVTKLSAPIGATLGARSTITVTIRAN